MRHPGWVFAHRLRSRMLVTPETKTASADSGARIAHRQGFASRHHLLVRRSIWQAALVVGLFSVLACSASSGTDGPGYHGPGTDAGGAGGGSGGKAGSGLHDGGVVVDSGGGTSGEAGPQCAASAPDLAGCPCLDPSAKPRVCYPSAADPATRGVGLCKDGVQACQGTSEFHTYGPCVGATVPIAEDCQNSVDDDCNGLVDCADPSCASATACQKACNDGETRPCYDGPPSTSGVGACLMGTQTCTGNQWVLDCVGEVVPTGEICASASDANCDGLAGCDDPTCTADVACTQACQDGEARPCYAGPGGTMNVGTCRAGTQTCTGGQWPFDCPGQVLPINEICNDLNDHNCNGFRGCDDIFVCMLDSYCWGECTTPDPGCVCPVGTSDDAVCPEGYLGTTSGGGLGTGKPPLVQCCPCTASDCANLGCCGTSACATSDYCAQKNCAPLPASCNGQVSFDCDFEDLGSASPPEDCDMPCCPCHPDC